MTIADKLTKASIAVGSFTADKINKEQAYSYISADQVLSRAGDALAKAGLAIIPEVFNEEVTAVPYGTQGKNRYDARVNFRMVITDGTDKIEAQWYGRGSDYAVPDKALYKAITSGHKYFLMKLLNIGVGNEDGEHESDRAEASGNGNKPQEIPEPKSLMTIEMANEIVSSIGTKYGDLDSDKLYHMLNSVQKVLNKGGLSPEEQEKYEYKKDGILTILRHRKAMIVRDIEPA